MSTDHMVALSQAERLRRKSDQNLVEFYSDELMEIDTGRYASDLLNSKIIQKLIRLGVLRPAKWRGRGKRGLSLTDKARDLMEKR